MALFDGRDRLYLRQWPSLRAQTTQVLPVIQHILHSANASLADVMSVGVAIGPGTFTGLRVGMSLAKGIALGRGIPIVGVPTLQAAALPWNLAGMTVVSMLPAGRGRLVWQRWKPGDGDDSLPEDPRNTTPAELAAMLEELGPDAMVGELSYDMRETFRSPSIPLIVGPEAPTRVGALASLAYDRYVRGEQDDPVLLEPRYVHGVRAASQAVRDPQP